MEIPNFVQKLEILAFKILIFDFESGATSESGVLVSLSRTHACYRLNWVRISVDFCIIATQFCSFSKLCTGWPCLQAAYVENLNGSQLFDSMYEADNDGQRINRVPAVEDLLASYPLQCKIITVFISLYIQYRNGKMFRRPTKIRVSSIIQWYTFHP